MNPRNERDEQKVKPLTLDPQKKKRFILVRLEERIAPAASTPTASLQGWTSDTRGNTNHT